MADNQTTAEDQIIAAAIARIAAWPAGNATVCGTKSRR